MSDRKISFEDAIRKLEEAASKLDRDDISLDEAIKSYEEGIKYYDICEEILNNAKQKIETFNNKL